MTLQKRNLRPKEFTTDLSKTIHLINHRLSLNPVFLFPNTYTNRGKHYLCKSCLFYEKTKITSNMGNKERNSVSWIPVTSGFCKFAGWVCEDLLVLLSMRSISSPDLLHSCIAHCLFNPLELN